MTCTMLGCKRKYFALDCLKQFYIAFFTLYLTKNIRFVQETFAKKKSCITELCKSFKNICNYVKFRIHTEKDWQYFYKTLQIQLIPLSAAKQFTLRSILYFKYSTLRKSSFHCNVLYHCQTIKLAVELMVKPLHT